MKKYLIMFVVAMMATLSASADKYTINRENLPEAAREMLDEYFPKAKVGMIKVDRHLLKKTDYDVKLVNGTKIEFDNSGKWTSVDCKTREVPEGLVMKAIRTYVKKNFADVKIVKIVKKTTSFEITLSDGVGLKFSRLGQFKGVIDI
ncbi:MAG: hypothetical protein HFJ87_06725 [Muribaculaceae bacterium]|nr:PepSY-like domain-containing protein [Muribaculaceae bacterium]MCI9054817.1 hypothetical protein [Muribaculaceae bacterium]